MHERFVKRLGAIEIDLPVLIAAGTKDDVNSYQSVPCVFEHARMRRVSAGFLFAKHDSVTGLGHLAVRYATRPHLSDLPERFGSAVSKKVLARTGRPHTPRAEILLVCHRATTSGAPPQSGASAFAGKAYRGVCVRSANRSGGRIHLERKCSALRGHGVGARERDEEALPAASVCAAGSTNRDYRRTSILIQSPGR
jgi:hypothetical protein